MNYLTQYYKNLSEQLQQKVNHLQRLVETAELTPDNFDGPDANKTGDTAEVVAGHKAMQLHNQIADLISRHHEKVTGESGDKMFKALTTRPYYTKKPFTSVEHAHEVMAEQGHEFMPYSISNPSGLPDPHEAEVIQHKVMQSIFDEQSKKLKSKSTKPFHIEDIDRVEGHEDNPDGWGARYVGIGPNGQKYSFWHTGRADDIRNVGRVRSDNPNITEISKIK
jgi:hypothetical protein